MFVPKNLLFKAISFSFGIRRGSITNYVINDGQVTPEWPATLLGENETAFSLIIKSQFADWGLSTDDSIYGGVDSFFKKFYYWGIIALQSCIRFCCTIKWVSYTYIYPLYLGSSSHPPSPSHLSRSSPRPSWAPCATQELSTSYLFYTW